VIVILSEIRPERAKRVGGFESKDLVFDLPTHAKPKSLTTKC